MGLAVEMEAAEVAHPPRVEDEAAVPDLPVGGNLEGGAVPARGGGLVLELAGAVRHPDPPPAGRGRIPVRALGELPLAVEKQAEIPRRQVGQPRRPGPMPTAFLANLAMPSIRRLVCFP